VECERAVKEAARERREREALDEESPLTPLRATPSVRRTTSVPPQDEYLTTEVVKKFSRKEK